MQQVIEYLKTEPWFFIVIVLALVGLFAIGYSLPKLFKKKKQRSFVTIRKAIADGKDANEKSAKVLDIMQEVVNEVER